MRRPRPVPRSLVGAGADEALQLSADSTRRSSRARDPNIRRLDLFIARPPRVSTRSPDCSMPGWLGQEAQKDSCNSSLAWRGRERSGRLAAGVRANSRRTTTADGGPHTSGLCRIEAPGHFDSHLAPPTWPCFQQVATVTFSELTPNQPCRLRPTQHPTRMCHRAARREWEGPQVPCN